MRIRMIKAEVGLTLRTQQYEGASVRMGAEAEVNLSLEESAVAHGQLVGALRERLAHQVPPVKQLSREAALAAPQGPGNGAAPPRRSDLGYAPPRRPPEPV